MFKYIPQVKRCYKCQKFGYISSKCFTHDRCVNCGKNHPSNRNCEEEIKCAHCEGNHRTSDVLCPCFQFCKEVNKVKIALNKSYREARDIVLRRYLAKYRSIDEIGESFKKVIKGLNLNDSILALKAKASATVANSSAVHDDPILPERVGSEAELRRSYTYRPFWTKLPKKMIKNIIIIKLFKYIVNITYFE